MESDNTIIESDYEIYQNLRLLKIKFKVEQSNERINNTPTHTYLKVTYIVNCNYFLINVPPAP